MKKIVIVGGGTAGWMSALIMARQWTAQGFQIELLESPAVEIIGVGEGSTPALKVFFDLLGIAEAEWMPECNATYKCGISFENWSTRPGYGRYLIFLQWIIFYAAARCIFRIIVRCLCSKLINFRWFNFLHAI